MLCPCTRSFFFSHVISPTLSPPPSSNRDKWICEPWRTHQRSSPFFTFTRQALLAKNVSWTCSSLPSFTSSKNTRYPSYSHSNLPSYSHSNPTMACFQVPWKCSDAMGEVSSNVLTLLPRTTQLVTFQKKIQKLQCPPSLLLKLCFSLSYVYKLFVAVGKPPSLRLGWRGDPGRSLSYTRGWIWIKSLSCRRLKPHRLYSTLTFINYIPTGVKPLFTPSHHIKRSCLGQLLWIVRVQVNHELHNSNLCTVSFHLLRFLSWIISRLYFASKTITNMTKQRFLVCYSRGVIGGANCGKREDKRNIPKPLNVKRMSLPKQHNRTIQWRSQNINFSSCLKKKAKAITLYPSEFRQMPKSLILSLIVMFISTTLYVYWRWPSGAYCNAGCRIRFPCRLCRTLLHDTSYGRGIP